MDDLVTWLLEQVEVDKGAALAASPGPWHANAEHDEVVAVDDITVCDGFALSNNQLRATVDHIANWDPKRVLAECEAKTKLVERYKRAVSAGSSAVSSYVRGQDDGYREACLDSIRDAAAVYAAMGRPGYREEWKP